MKALTTQQANFEAGIEVLQKSATETLSSAQASNDLIEKIGILESGILEQEHQIFLTSKTIIPTLILKEQCQNISSEDKAQIV